MKVNMELEVIIGLEIHVQLKTKTKMFCAVNNDADGQDTNTLISSLCLGHPGTLPVVNDEAINFGIKAGLALGCDIASKIKFDRKHYFYPDLPKGYQISQFDMPLCGKGSFDVTNAETGDFSIGITRIHLEEDAGKSFHMNDANHSYIDYNRAGTPLIEIVTEPDFKTPQQARIFLQELRTTLRSLEISDAEMEKGHLRCDANISLRPLGEDKLYPKTEIKNINSFRSVQKALMYEIERQTALWEAGNPPMTSATRGWDEDTQKTLAQRDKEESADYRYFPEPDIPMIDITPERIASVKATMRELPNKKRQRFANEYMLSDQDIQFYIENPDYANYFEQVMSELISWYHDKTGPVSDEDNKKLAILASTWLKSKLPATLQKFDKTYEQNPINAENFAELLAMLYSKEIPATHAQTVLNYMCEHEKESPEYLADPSHIVEKLGLSAMDNTDELRAIVEEVIKNNPDQVAQYKAGKESVAQFFMGQVMRATKGSASPQDVMTIIKEILTSMPA